ncbi:polycystin family receptor for egg jelly [Drosophila tropicalis]|uniref:polycystin family receptor for egg jelly n=1 Tax=Drosophila tropicalis TaxID=46794 RepID=UPI0035ABD1BB
MWQPLGIIILVLSYTLMCINGDHNVLTNMNLKIFFNRILPYGQATIIVITANMIPDEVEVVIRLNTESYLLVFCSIGKVSHQMPPKFERTNSISRELSYLNVKADEKVTYETGFFARVNATFWSKDDKYMNLLLRVPSKSWVKEDRRVIKIQIENTNAEPRLQMLKCQNPDLPRYVTIARSLLVQTVFVKSSKKVIKTIYRWQLRDLTGETRYSTFHTNHNAIFLKRYSLRFYTKYELWRNQAMLYVEGRFEGQKFAARCYLNIAMGSVEAVIGGGAERIAQYSTGLIMDGSTSRDYSKQETDKQFAKYYWNCESFEDYRNPNCIRNISTLPQFTIPAYSFRPNFQYIFRLLVEAEDNPSRKSRMIQTVQMVKQSILQVMIYCVFNCALDMYSPHSKVRLKAKCLDCGGQKISYQWYVSGQLTLTTEDLTMFIRIVATTAVVKLIIQTEDGRTGQQVKHFKKNLGPTVGHCTVNPITGTEAITAFYPCCKNFGTRYSPMEYWYYAGRVLLNSCYDCTCEVHLPVVSEIRILVCDSFLACCSSSVEVHITPLQNVTADTPNDVWNYLVSEPHHILSLVDEGYYLRYLQTIQSVATHIHQVDAAVELLRALNGSDTCTRSSLGKLANLTQTLAHQLKPIDPLEHRLLTSVVAALNDNFACVYQFNMEYLLVEQPFINVTQGCVTVYDIMNRLSMQAPRPPKSIYSQFMAALKNQTLNQRIVDKLTEEIKNFKDEDAKFRSLVWLNSKWQTERLYRFLGIARAHGLQPDENGDILTEGVALELQCFYIERDRTYYIETSDSMHKVEFKPALLQELKEGDDNWICLKVISTIRELHWWYPEEKQPSSVLLSVRIFHTVDNFRVEVPLRKSVITFTTIIGKYRPAKDYMEDISAHRITRSKDLLKENSYIDGRARINYDTKQLATFKSENDIEDYEEIEHIDPEERVSDVGKYINAVEVGTLTYMQDVLLYRILLEELTLLAVRFTKSTHKLHVAMTINNPPLFSQVSASDCFVPENLTSKTILFRNNCYEYRRVYMAVRVWGENPPDQKTKTLVPNGPAEFSFIFQMRSCDYWVYSKPLDERYWSHDGCIPSMIVNVSRGMRCTCSVLGTYTSYVYNVPAIVVTVDPYAQVETNFAIIIVYAFIVAALVLWLLWLFMYNSISPSKTVVCEMVDMEETSASDVHDILIQIKTGGRYNANTTASVRLSFFSTQRQELQFTLMQDPEHPDLLRNTTYILWLRTRDIRIPTKVAVSHNNNGRFPSWFLQHIEVCDVQTQETQVFVVHRWVKTKILVLTSSLIFKRGDVRFVGSWFRRFRVQYETVWTNWALFQPVWGTWRETNQYPSMSRFKRVCVFISKMVIIYSIIACGQGRTTVESLQKDRSFFVPFGDWLFYSVFCYIAGILVQMFYEWILLQYA